MSALTKEQKTLVYQRTKRAFRKYTLLKKWRFLRFMAIVFVVFTAWDMIAYPELEMSVIWPKNVLIAVAFLVANELPLFLMIRNRYQIKELRRSERMSVKKV